MNRQVEKIYAIALSIISSPSVNRIWDNIWSRTPCSIYNDIPGRNNLRVQDFIASRYSGDPLAVAERIYYITERIKVNVIDYWDHNYPGILKEIHNPPLVIYCNGEMRAEKAVAVVGTRKSDEVSESVARRIAGELAENDITVISGMAVGIDREAHLGALQGGGRTIGVLANGIDISYPSGNRDLYEMIRNASGSALISEYPPGIIAGKWTFVRRNRIISGMSLGTVVIKAAGKSGALLTAGYSLDQNREIFACPGYAFDEGYSGCHKLIKNGAVLVSNTSDILTELNLPLRKKGNNHKSADNTGINYDDSNNVPLDGFSRNSLDIAMPVEREVMNLLYRGRQDIDMIISSLGYGPGEINEAIMMLELSGMIERRGNIISVKKYL